MDDNLGHIDDLYSNLRGATSSSPGVDWYDLAPKVNRFNFFKIRYNTFNIFYASVIGIASLVTGYIGVTSALTPNISDKNINTNIMYQFDTLELPDTINIIDTVFFSTPPPDEETESQQVPTSSILKDTTPVDLNWENTTQADSIIEQTKKSTINNTKEVTAKKVKRVTVIRRKKIIVRDTLFVDTSKVVQ